MNGKKTLVASGIALAVLLLCLALMLGQVFRLSHNLRESPLHTLILPYRMGTQTRTAPASQLFEADSAEIRLLQGLVPLNQGRAEEAMVLFEQALSLPHTDPALPTYLHYYLNYCTCLITGRGDIQRVQAALDAAAQCPFLSGDAELIQSLIYTLVASPQWAEDGATLLTRYLKQVTDLPLLSWVRLKNILGMLEYGMQQYGRAIRHFYDVEMAAAEQLEREDSDTVRAELILAKNYIANIHYSMEHYDRTIQLYREIIQEEGDNPDTAYSHYINLIGVCIEVGRLEEAQTVARQLDTLLPRLDPLTALETRACLDDLLANLCMSQGDYAQAEVHLLAAEDYYHSHLSYCFPGGEYFVALTRGKYLARLGQHQAALEVLIPMLEQGQAACYGLTEEIYEELIFIYEAMGKLAELVSAHESLLAIHRARANIIQTEYLEFSSYYRDIAHLRAHTPRLSRTTALTILTATSVLVLLIILSMLHWMLRAKHLTDPLTGVYNRRQLLRLTRRFRRFGTPACFGVILCEPDSFQCYKDTHGHPAGEQLIRQVAHILSNCLRKQDTVIRYGEEVFLLLLQEVSGEAAEAIGHRIRQQLALASEVSDHVTLSMGLCHQNSPRKATLDELIQQADQCLYCARQNGRNQLNSKHLP